MGEMTLKDDTLVHRKEVLSQPAEHLPHVSPLQAPCFPPSGPMLPPIRPHAPCFPPSGPMFPCIRPNVSPHQAPCPMFPPAGPMLPPVGPIFPHAGPCFRPLQAPCPMFPPSAPVFPLAGPLFPPSCPLFPPANPLFPPCWVMSASLLTAAWKVLTSKGTTQPAYSYSPSLVTSSFPTLPFPSKVPRCQGECIAANSNVWSAHQQGDLVPDHTLTHLCHSHPLFPPSPSLPMLGGECIAAHSNVRSAHQQRDLPSRTLLLTFATHILFSLPPLPFQGAVVSASLRTAVCGVHASK
ncbi:unnamed protein product [Closterium sp. NIES-64]|nr:unnamed protein product [Closterium sp. NIES-64]